MPRGVSLSDSQCIFFPVLVLISLSMEKFVPQTTTHSKYSHCIPRKLTNSLQYFYKDDAIAIFRAKKFKTLCQCKTIALTSLNVLFSFSVQKFF